MTARETIIYAIYRIATSPYSGAVARKNSIVMECWLLNKVTFGLDGFPEHPDSHRVSMELPKLFNEGYIQRPQPNCYRLTHAGWVIARRLHEERKLVTA